MYKVINGDNYCVINGEIELHPHNENMKLYKPDDIWQVYVNDRWVDCVVPPDWCDSVAFRKHPHSDLIKQYTHGDTWQFSVNDRWISCTCSPSWDDGVTYRKHPHNDLMREYVAGEQWQCAYVDQPKESDWVDCADEPGWRENRKYRKKPEPKIITLYRVPGTNLYQITPEFALIAETFQQIS